MLDLGLISAAKKAIASKSRHLITAEHLLAVVQQESAGVPYFVDTKPGSLYSQNINAALKYYKWHKKPDGTRERLGPFYTGFKFGDVRQMILIPEKIGDWKVPASMVGKPAKFRFEYGYWESRKYQHLNHIDRFYMSCSWGVVQFMGPNITKTEDIQFIKRFAADVPLQLLYGAGMLDDLLTKAGGDLNRAYKAYNSGDLDSQNPDVVARAKNVVQTFNRLRGKV